MPFGRVNNARETDKVLPSGLSTGRFLDGTSLSKEADKLKMEDKGGPDPLVLADERKHLLTTRKLEAEMQSQETVESQAFLTTASQLPDSASTRSGLSFSKPVDGKENGHLQVGKVGQAPSITNINKQGNPEAISWTGIGSHNEVPRGSLPPTTVQHELVPDKNDNAPSLFQSLGNNSISGKQPADNCSSYFLLAPSC